MSCYYIHRIQWKLLRVNTTITRNDLQVNIALLYRPVVNEERTRIKAFFEGHGVHASYLSTRILTGVVFICFFNIVIHWFDIALNHSYVVLLISEDFVTFTKGPVYLKAFIISFFIILFVIFKYGIFKLPCIFGTFHIFYFRLSGSRLDLHSIQNCMSD